MYNNSSAGLMYPMVCPFWNFTVVLFFFFTPLLGCMVQCMKLQLYAQLFLLKIINYCIDNIYDVCVYIVFPNNSFVNRLQQQKIAKEISQVFHFSGIWIHIYIYPIIYICNIVEIKKEVFIVLYYHS